MRKRRVAASNNFGTGPGKTMKYMRRTASGAAGNGLGTAIKFLKVCVWGGGGVVLFVGIFRVKHDKNMSVYNEPQKHRAQREQKLIVNFASNPRRLSKTKNARAARKMK
jgi:hypothetical protein